MHFLHYWCNSQSIPSVANKSLDLLILVLHILTPYLYTSVYLHIFKVSNLQLNNLIMYLLLSYRRLETSLRIFQSWLDWPIGLSEQWVSSRTFVPYAKKLQKAQTSGHCRELCMLKAYLNSQMQSYTACFESTFCALFGSRNFMRLLSMKLCYYWNIEFFNWMVLGVYKLIWGSALTVIF